jgi:hypothetical protein
VVFELKENDGRRSRFVCWEGYFGILVRGD